MTIASHAGTVAGPAGAPCALSAAAGGLRLGSREGTRTRSSMADMTSFLKGLARVKRKRLRGGYLFGSGQDGFFARSSIVGRGLRRDTDDLWDNNDFLLSSDAPESESDGFCGIWCASICVGFTGKLSVTTLGPESGSAFSSITFQLTEIFGI